MRLAFVVDIDINDGMTQQEVRRAIDRSFSVEDSPITLFIGDEGIINDSTGNEIGHWKVVEVTAHSCNLCGD